MQTKTVKCPSCGVVLEVRNSKNEEVKIINCPQCGMALRVRFHLHTDEVMDAETQIAGRSEDNETVIAEMGCSAEKAFIVCEGIKYELQEGHNIVGRKARTSTADIQLAVSDRYMSRHNAIVSVGKTGDKLLVTIKKHKNLNPIKVGDVVLLDGDELVLDDGDELTMGETKMTLKIE